jgi:D-alanyl-D-alanine carboxypeptidase (penicillin-binding protein 5/6)
VKKLVLVLAGLCFIASLMPCALAAEAPAVSAASAVLLDAGSGRVLYAKDQDQPRAIASITKLMTALVAAEYFDDWSQAITIKQEWTGIEGTSLYLEAGEELRVETLLYGLLLHSGNDGAMALAGAAAGDIDTFVAWMNQRAADLGMTGTHFSDPSGLGDEDHYSTALDMARLGAAVLENDRLAQIVATRSITLEGRSLTNHNKLLWQYPGCTGMKTGYTRQAGRTLVSSAEKDGQTLVCVTLNDPNDWADHAALLDYGFQAYPQAVAVEAGQVLGQVPLTGSLKRQVGAVARDTIAYPLQAGEEIRLEVILPETVAAPVVQGQVAGEVIAWVGEREIGRSYLVWQAAAPRDVSPRAPVSSLWDFLRD